MQVSVQECQPRFPLRARPQHQRDLWQSETLAVPQIREHRHTNTWRRVSWDEALDFITRRMQKIGPEEAGLWAGHGSFTPD